MDADSSYQLASKLLDFVSARDGRERRELLRTHPELLTEDADGWLEAYIFQARESGDWNAERTYAEHRQLLAECRRAGLAALNGFFNYRELELSFRRFAGLKDMAARRAYLERHPELLSDKARLVIAEAIAAVKAQGQAGQLRRYRLCRDLLQACRCRPVAAVFDVYQLPPPEVLHAVNAVLAAGSARLLVEAALARARFLSRPVVRNAFNYLYPLYEDDPHNLARLEHLREFLNGMYKLGIERPGDIAAEVNLQAIAAGLQRMQDEGGAANFLIVTAGQERSAYVQFAGRCGDPLVFVEAVNPAYLSPYGAADQEQIDRLYALGWKLNWQNPEENFYRLWKIEGEADLLALARRVVQVFVEVYGLPPQQEYLVEIHLG